MDPIELLTLCRRGAYEGAPDDILVPRLFSAGEFEAVWKTDPSQVRRILDETLCGPLPGEGLELLMKSGALYALIPELEAMRNLGDGEGMHKDVWEHTKVVVSSTPATVEMRWSALFHDIGKARTRRVYSSGKVTFHNHDMVGAKMVDKIEERLDLFQDDATLFTTVRSLVLNHLRPAGYKKDWTDSGVRRLLTDLGGMRNFECLMALSRADLTTKNANKRDRALARGRELEERVKEIYAEDNAPKLPKGTMGLILERSGRKPGKWLNDLRENLEERMKIDNLPVGERTIEFFVTEGLETLKDSG